MNLEKTLINEIKNRILSAAKPVKIIIFGSAATGRMNKDSDIDILVVEASAGNARQKSLRLRNSLRGLGTPFDVIVISRKWFEASKDVVGGIAYPANKYGKVIYESA